MAALSDAQLVAFAERVKGKVVFITGAASGIGKTAAFKFAQYGAKIAIADLDENGAANTVEEIVKEGGEAFSIKCNIVEWDDQVAAYEATLTKFGSIDVVVSNAGIPETTRLQNITIVDGKPVKPQLRTLEVNLTGNIYTVHLAQHYLKQGSYTQGDLKAVVVVSSIAAYYSPGAPTYSAAKAGLMAITRALEPYFTRDGVRVGLIHPFFADTAILQPQVRALLAGLTLTPVDRIAGAIFLSATDPNLKTSACAYLLPDDGPVLQVEKEALLKAIHPGMLEGNYAEIYSRLSKVYGFAPV